MSKTRNRARSDSESALGWIPGSPSRKHREHVRQIGAPGAGGSGDGVVARLIEPAPQRQVPRPERRRGGLLPSRVPTRPARRATRPRRRARSPGASCRSPARRRAAPTRPLPASAASRAGAQRADLALAIDERESRSLRASLETVRPGPDHTGARTTEQQWQAGLRDQVVGQVVHRRRSSCGALAAAVEYRLSATVSSGGRTGCDDDEG